RAAPGPRVAGTRRASPASSPSRPPGAGWPVTRSGTKPASGRCRKQNSACRPRTGTMTGPDRPGAREPLLHSAPTTREGLMAHLFQAGAGGGGMPVLDMACRDERVTHVTLVEPDVFKPHNVVRHVFPPTAVGKPKAELARAWLLE